MNRSYSLWIIAIGVVASAIWALWPNQNIDPPAVTTTSHPSDRDSTAEEVRAAATRINEVEQKIEAASERSQSETSALRVEIAEELDSIRQMIDSPTTPDPNATELPALISKLTERIAALETRVISPILPDDYEVSFPAPESDMIIWVEPVAVPSSRADITPAALAAAAPQLAQPHPPPPQPALTLPANTIVHSTAITALVGRLPLDGRVESPWRFKAMSSAENITSRHLSIPGLAGVIWSGFAYGDLTLSCVSGSIDTITYVFDDGTVHTQKSEHNPDDITVGLGWISDEYGNPCVPGELKTNAPAVISRGLAAGSLAGIARGYADAQTEQRRDSDGTTVRTVTGDIDRYAMANAVADAAQEIDVWIRRRIGQSFDAIYVPPATEIVIHVEMQIDVDYAEQGRRLTHNVHGEDADHAQHLYGGHD